MELKYVEANLPIRNSFFEEIVIALSRNLLKMSGIKQENTLFAPPVMPRSVLEKTGYYLNFPHLLGGIVTLCPDNNYYSEKLLTLSENHVQNWHNLAIPSDIVLTPAACYFAYTLAENSIIESLLKIALQATCYRHEPSDNPMRLRSFRMQEIVFIGDKDECNEAARSWFNLAGDFLNSIGLTTKVELANDPFFGRMREIKLSIQKTNAQKFEQIWIWNNQPTSLISVNFHETHFSEPFKILLPDKNLAHTACVAFGLDRITNALLKVYGTSKQSWPERIKMKLGIINEH